MRQLAFGLIVACATMSLVLAGQIQDALDATDRGDYAAALQILRPLAEQGDSTAQLRLGYMYAEGLGVPQDYSEAMKWTRSAAQHGNPAAQYFLAGMYQYGKGVPKGEKKAIEWFRKAAAQGYANAYYALGSAYETGKGVRQDDVYAHMWYNLAAARYQASQAKLRDQAVASRNSIATRMNADQIAEAQRLAREWKPAKQ